MTEVNLFPMIDILSKILGGLVVVMIVAFGVSKIVKRKEAVKN